jgi:membrane protein required for colicin V production
MDLVAIGWVDLALLAVLVISIAVGVVRGFVFEVASLAGWVVAWLAAQWLAADVAPHLPVGTRGSALNLGAAFAIVFVLALLIWGLAARLVRMVVHATPLSPIDRVLGAVFGALRGAVLLLAVALVVGLTPWAKPPAWQQSHAAGVLGAALNVLLPLLPPPLSAHLRRA